MGTRDLHAEALLIKAKNGIKGILSKIEVSKLLKASERIAEEIHCPEVLWKVYFEYGRFFQDNKEYFKTLNYYRKSMGVFKSVMSKIKNESYKKSYFNRSDRQAVFIGINEIERLLH